jgi:hypothetical protein
MGRFCASNKNFVPPFGQGLLSARFTTDFPWKAESHCCIPIKHSAYVTPTDSLMAHFRFLGGRHAGQEK